jgi:nucleotide-binding universal stress UspA family protein
MMRRILTVLDPSPATVEADVCAFRLAAATGAELTGIAIADVAARRAATAAMGIGTSDLAREARQRAIKQERKTAQSALQLFSDLCRKKAVCANLVCVEADTVQSIVSESLNHDLIIFGASAVPGEEESAELVANLMRVGPRPILAIGKNLGDVTPNRVLIGIDDHPQSWKSLHMFLLLMPAELVEEVTLVSLVSPDHHDIAEARLGKARKMVEAYGIRAATICQEGDPVEMIPRLARATRATTIVLGPYSKPTLQRIFFGSVTRKILERAEFSLFLYH